MGKQKSVWGGLLISSGFFVLYASSASATISQSPNYQVDESVIGNGGLNQSSSQNFKSSNATGDIAVGTANSGNFRVDSGSQTTRDLTLSFSIDTLDVNFGKFSPGTAAVTTADFSVANYTSYGYVVQIVGEPPTNGAHAIDPLETASDSIEGVEQFGINLVANTLPRSVGTNLKNGPNSFGEIAPNYSTSNKYRYVSGETIAFAPKSSGETAYTISYLVNVAPLTPGGVYTSKQTLIVTGTY